MSAVNGWFNYLRLLVFRIGGGTGMRLILGIVIVTGVIASAILGWAHFGDKILKDQLLTEEMLETTSQPSWIRANVKSEVMVSANLASRSIYDPELTIQIAKAFELHDWVEKVKLVSKQPPGNVRVDVVYRRPVGMVQIPTGLLPIDRHAVLLPTVDFAPQQVRNYLRIMVDDCYVTGPIGTPWEDPSISGAARLADVLIDDWRHFGIYRIRAIERSGAQKLRVTQYVLQSRQGIEVIWGHAPGEETEGESTSAQKLKALIKFVDNNGPLDDRCSFKVLDLRSGKAIPAEVALLDNLMLR